MHVLAHAALLRLGENNIPIQKQLRAQRRLYETCLAMIEGQQMDIGFENRLDVRVSDYLDMIDGKTAALIACSLELGCLLSTDDESLIDGFRELGRNLGLAFQIIDDILGIWGDAGQTGKPVASDILRRKKSLPIVYALETMAGREDAELAEIYRQENIDGNDVDRVLRILDDVQARDHAQAMAERYRNGAFAEMDKMALSSWARSSLQATADFLLERKF